jgi:pimeloyl-ACP methyl ester carboxylesterase
VPPSDPSPGNPLPPELIASWMEPGLHDPGRETRREKGHDRDEQALHDGGRSRSCASSDLPVLLTWAPGDRVFPLKWAERFVAEVPNARLVQIPDSRTFVRSTSPSASPTRSPPSSSRHSRVVPFSGYA